MLDPAEMAMYKDRVDGGLYDELGSQIDALGSTFLGEMIFNKDFEASIIQWSKNVAYITPDGAEVRPNIVGQIHPTSLLNAPGAFRFEGQDGRVRACTVPAFR